MPIRPSWRRGSTRPGAAPRDRKGRGRALRLRGPPACGTGALGHAPKTTVPRPAKTQSALGPLVLSRVRRVVGCTRGATPLCCASRTAGRRARDASAGSCAAASIVGIRRSRYCRLCFRSSPTTLRVSRHADKQGSELSAPLHGGADLHADTLSDRSRGARHRADRRAVRRRGHEPGRGAPRPEGDPQPVEPHALDPPRDQDRPLRAVPDRRHRRRGIRAGLRPPGRGRRDRGFLRTGPRCGGRAAQRRRRPLGHLPHPQGHRPERPGRPDPYRRPYRHLGPVPGLQVHARNALPPGARGRPDRRRTDRADRHPRRPEHQRGLGLLPRPGNAGHLHGGVHPQGRRGGRRGGEVRGRRQAGLSVRERRRSEASRPSRPWPCCAVCAA
jgi:hypothetical protein